MDKEKEKSFQNDDALMKRLEGQLDDIENAEIMHDMSRETLEHKGFIGEKSIEIKRSSQKAGTEKEHLFMAEGVEFTRLPDSDNFSSLTLQSLLHLKSVKKGQLIH